MNINLREEETNRYMQLYMETLEAYQEQNNRFITVCNDVLATSKYDKLRGQILAIINSFEDQIKSDVENGIFEEWSESEASLQSCLHRYQAGEDAENVCVQIENWMKDQMYDTLIIDRIEAPLTDRPEVSDAGLDALEEISGNVSAELEAIRDEYRGRIESQANDNDIYGTLLPLIIGIGSKLSSFMAGTKVNFEKFHEEVREIVKQIQADVDEAIAQGNVTGNNVAEQSDNTTDSDIGVSSVSTALGEGITGDRKEDAEDKVGKVSDGTKEEITPENNREKHTQKQRVENHISNGDRAKQTLQDAAESLGDVAGSAGKVISGVGETAKNVAETAADVVANGKGTGKLAAVAAGLGAAAVVGNAIKHLGEGKSTKDEEIMTSAKTEEVPEKGGADSDNDEKDSSMILTEKLSSLSDEQRQYFIKICEMIIEEGGGPETINAVVDKDYASLEQSVKRISVSNKTKQPEEQAANTSGYGRYKVTDRSIQFITPYYEQAKYIMTPIDEFYKKRFANFDEKYDRANRAIHNLSTFIGGWGMDKLDELTKEKKSDKNSDESADANSADSSNKTESEKSIDLRKVLAWAALTSQMKWSIGGALAVGILDKVMPQIKKSKILMRLSEKMWKLTNMGIQIPPQQAGVDRYFREHYEIKYGVITEDQTYVPYYHYAANKIKEDEVRRGLENAILSSECAMYYVNYQNRNDPKAFREECCGVFLNLMRSGMCNEKNIEDEKLNSAVDAMYDQYTSKEGITPDVSIDAGQRIVCK